MSDPHRLLFLCVANSARSQMAEGLARAMGGEHVHVQSAGSRPAYVHPAAIQVLSELGVDISEQWSKSVEDIDPESVDTVVTLCAEEECPLFLGKAARLHWEQPDPVGHDQDSTVRKFRVIRDNIRRQLSEWMEARDIPVREL